MAISATPYALVDAGLGDDSAAPIEADDDHFVRNACFRAECASARV